MVKIAHGKITDIIVAKGSLRAAWPDIQEMGLPDGALNVIAEIVQADRMLMSERGKSGERKSIDPDIRAEIERLVNRGGITSGKLVKALADKFGKDRAPSRATAHRYMSMMTGSTILRLPKELKK